MASIQQHGMHHPLVDAYNYQGTCIFRRHTDIDGSSIVNVTDVNATYCTCGSCNATYDNCNYQFDLYGNCPCDACTDPNRDCLSTTSTVTPHQQRQDSQYEFDDEFWACLPDDNGTTEGPFTVLCDSCNPNHKVANEYDIEFPAPENTSRTKNKTHKANNPVPTAGQSYTAQGPVNSRGKSTSKKSRNGLVPRTHRNKKYRDFTLTKGKSRVIIPNDDAD